MRYPPEALAEYEREFPRIVHELIAVYAGAIAFAQERLTHDDAKKFMIHGVGRRLGLIRRCAERIFDAFPPERTFPLAREDIEDVNICLHAFIIHSNALQDNLAWSYVKEFNVQLNSRHDVSLFKDALRNRLPAAMRAYLNNEDVRNWHATYSTEYRDGLAHRLPLYVPPAQLTDEDVVRANQLQELFNEMLRRHDWEALVAVQDEINSQGISCPYFLHEFNAQPVVLHPQILCDALTVIELYKTVTENWGEPVAP
ncbi:MAG: hypothetical protein ACREO7_10145 [Pseudoxanthomonas sp.]